MLTLPIKKKWFDMIKSGEKKEEYREIKPYYDSRFKSLIADGQVHQVILRNGYSKKSPAIKCDVLINQYEGKEEWGAEPNKGYYVLQILSIKEL